MTSEKKFMIEITRDSVDGNLHILVNYCKYMVSFFGIVPMEQF